MNSRMIQRLKDKNDAQELWDMEDLLSLISSHCEAQIEAAYSKSPTPSAPLTIASLPYLLRGLTPPSVDGVNGGTYWPGDRRFWLNSDPRVS